jgi:DNA-binding FrmR family transcriptional regulator
MTGLETRTIRPNGRLAAIRELLEHDAVCLDIVRYLVHHSEAADTARGIADWWIQRDVARTAHALTKLLEHGVVRSHLVQDATAVYAFTRNPLLRETLRQYVRSVSPAVTAGASLMPGPFPHTRIR